MPEPSISRPTSYDLVVYPSYTHPQTHPDRLAVIGTLLGLEPAPPNRCRVLELGCGDGSNLVPMAWGLPNSEFVGVDLAAGPIARGHQMIIGLSLDNIRLHQANVTTINGEWGKFDYIIAHGLYSWVPAQVREHLLTICHDLLAPQGIAFVSYNALPGGHLRNMLREMMLFHVRGFDSPAERVQQAKALVQFLVEARHAGDDYRLWLERELEGILEHEQGHLYHDELAEISESFYFTRFIEDAAAHGLQYLAEADYCEMFDHWFTDSAQHTLQQLSANRLLHEQYLDFLKCRRFRQTLLCHRHVTLRTEALVEKVPSFWVSSAARCMADEIDLREGATNAFQTPKGARCVTDFALGNAVLAMLGGIWPTPLSFGEILAEATRSLEKEKMSVDPQDQARQKLSAFLLKLYSGGVVEFRTTLPPFARHAGDRPVTSAVARWQIQHGDSVTTVFHLGVKVEDEVGRLLLSSLDGTLDRKALLEKLWRLLESRNALVIPHGDESAARRELQLKLEENLEKLARLGLLVA